SGLPSGDAALAPVEVALPVLLLAVLPTVAPLVLGMLAVVLPVVCMAAPGAVNTAAPVASRRPLGGAGIAAAALLLWAVAPVCPLVLDGLHEVVEAPAMALSAPVL